MPLLRQAKPFGILEKCCLVRLWRVGTNTLYILRTTGSWFVRFVAQPYIYSFQGSDWFILARTVVRVKCDSSHIRLHRMGFLAEFYNTFWGWNKELRCKAAWFIRICAAGVIAVLQIYFTYSKIIVTSNTYRKNRSSHYIYLVAAFFVSKFPIKQRPMGD